ncbi:hypothetical protein F4821DRAFT_227718 [Hypoxylon rubiginosum]|uniref:Uncharacterized protein n=1 Tax=Hypoxylon rubiginosum TaxID=110542 RepID=A0ACC0DDT3_9PEZI|nr:hypothetical protein F4821DRAFT_227718 [Hypoxylon rubiginosum]
MSKTLSDDLGPTLELQGIPWIVRKAVSFATITGKLTQTTDEKGTTQIVVDQTATGGIKGETETYVLDGSESRVGSSMFGFQNLRTQWVSLDDQPMSFAGGPLDPWLQEGWLEESSGTHDHVQVYTVSEKGWSAEHIWGFALRHGERYYAKKILLKKGEDSLKANVVYEWKGPLVSDD